LERAGIAWFPWMVVGANAALLACAMALPRHREEGHPSQAVPRVWQILRQPEVRWLFLSIGLTVLAHTAMYAFLSLYLVSLGYGKGMVGAVWAVSVVAEIVFFWFQGRFFTRWAPVAWLACVAWITAARLAIIGMWGHVVWVLLAVQVTHAVTFAGHHGACLALIQQHFPGRLRGRGQALYSVLGYGLPGAVGGVGGAWIIERWGFGAVFAAASLAALLAAGCVHKMRLAR
jgi:MFS transporter, PPP family, 3-phenylpropionic acid transporter